jgi:hypothetical protein
MQRTSKGDCKAPEIVYGEAIRGWRSVLVGSCSGVGPRGGCFGASLGAAVSWAHFLASDGSASVRRVSWRGDSASAGDSPDAFVIRHVCGPATRRGAADSSTASSLCYPGYRGRGVSE